MEMLIRRRRQTRTGIPMLRLIQTRFRMQTLIWMQMRKQRRNQRWKQIQMWAQMWMQTLKRLG